MDLGHWIYGYMTGSPKLQYHHPQLDSDDACMHVIDICSYVINYMFVFILIKDTVCLKITPVSDC